MVWMKWIFESLCNHMHITPPYFQGHKICHTHGTICLKYDLDYAIWFYVGIRIEISQRSKTEMKIAFKNSGCLVAENNVLFCIHKYDNKAAMTTDNNNNGYSSWYLKQGPPVPFKCWVLFQKSFSYISICYII